MPVRIVCNDIIKMDCDAMVNSTEEHRSDRGGASSAAELTVRRGGKYPHEEI